MEVFASIDLETLDTRATSVVLSAGVCLFTRDDVLPSLFSRRLELQAQFAAGRTISEDTLLWWMGRRKGRDGAADTWEDMAAAQRAAFVGDRAPVASVLGDMCAWAKMQDCKITRWYANGPSFDSAILEHLAQQFYVKVPWFYNQPRCLRTVCEDLLPKDAWPKREGTYHSAIDDAVYQAQVIQAAWRRRVPHPGA